MEKPFSLNQKIISEIYEIYKSVVEDSYKKLNLPKTKPLLQIRLLSEQLIADIIQKVFWTTLEKEEGRFHQFSVSVERPETTDILFLGTDVPYVFERHYPLDSLNKLAPALDSTDNSILVWADENNQSYAWGFNEIIHNNLKIIAISTGKIKISIGFSHSILFDGSRIETIKNVTNLFGLLVSANDQEFIEKIDWGLLTKIAKLMRSHSHGGTLLIVSIKKSFNKLISQSVVFGSSWIHQAPSKKLEGWTSLQNKNVDSLVESFTSDDYLALIHMDKVTKLISQLTAVDGATIITNNFNVLAFGAKIKSEKSTNLCEEVLVSEPFEKSQQITKALSSLGGTRHQSAAQFVYDCKEAFAIVVSQDGTVSLMSWNEGKGKVEVVQHAEYLFL